MCTLGWCYFVEGECEMKKGGDGFDVEDEYDRFRRRQRIHRMHLVGYAVSAALVLIGMLLFWR